MSKSVIPDLNDEYGKMSPDYFFNCPKCGSKEYLTMEGIYVDTINESVECYPDEIVKAHNLENILNPDEMIVSIGFSCHICGYNFLYRLESMDKRIGVYCNPTFMDDVPYDE